MYERIKEYLDPGTRVLDLGAGDCLLAQRIQIERACRTTCVDVADENWTSMELTVYDGVHLPYPSDSFDSVVIAFVLHHCVEAERVLGEARRVCRGNVIVLEDRFVSSWDRLAVWAVHWLMERGMGMSDDGLLFHRPEAWKQLLEDHGFAVEVCRELGYAARMFPTRGYLMVAT
jgi:ubiquinone/menaquinone biosynthesis C-methylase UbiE